MLALVLFSGTPPGVLDATWAPPATNAAGDPLTDLASYRVYYATSPVSCGASHFVEMPSPVGRPRSDQLVLFRLTELAERTAYHVVVSAVNTVGVESACSPMTTAIARRASTAPPLVTIDVVGSGAVRSIPGRTDCDGPCVLEYPGGTLMVLTPLAGPGWVFTEWRVVAPSSVIAVFRRQ